MKYQELVQAVSDLHQTAARRVATVANQTLVLRNWLIGARVVEFEQAGEDRAAYGQKLLESLARDLRMANVSGCSSVMLGRMRLLYQRYPQIREWFHGDVIPSAPLTELAMLAEDIAPHKIPSAPLTESGASLQPLSCRLILRLSWSKLIELIRIDDPLKRAFYENACLTEGWSLAELQRQIGSLLYERTGLSTDKAAVIQHAREQVAAGRETMPSSLAELIRDPYILEFTGLPDRGAFLESNLEIALLDHLQRFLLELGTGFCFEARQKRIMVGNQHDFIDLVFYHRVLRSHLLIDLKVRAFDHGDAGQMNFYLNWWKDHMVGEGDNPPVGLILCADKDQSRVEYATAGLDRQLFISRYLVSLPKPEELQRLLEQDRAFLEQRKEETP